MFHMMYFISYKKEYFEEENKVKTNWLYITKTPSQKHAISLYQAYLVQIYWGNYTLENITIGQNLILSKFEEF